MKYHVVVDGEALTVELVERGGRTFVLDGGAEVPVDLCAVRGGSYSLLLGSRSLPIVASGPNDDLTLTLGAETWRASVRDQREAHAGGGGRTDRAGGGVVRAVMPGIVRAVLVETGRPVARGAPLLILEAMKMQNEVRSAVEGTVSQVHVRPGTAVAKGDALVTVS